MTVPISKVADAVDTALDKGGPRRVPATLPRAKVPRMNWLHDRSSQLPTKAEIDSLYFHLAILIVVGLLLAFGLGFTLGARMWSHGSVKCGMGAQENKIEHTASKGAKKAASVTKTRTIGG